MYAHNLVAFDITISLVQASEVASTIKRVLLFTFYPQYFGIFTKWLYLQIPQLLVFLARIIFIFILICVIKSNCEKT